MLNFTKLSAYTYEQKYTLDQLIQCLEKESNPTYGLLLNIAEYSGITKQLVTTQWVGWAGRQGLLEALYTLKEKGMKELEFQLPIEFGY